MEIIKLNTPSIKIITFVLSTYNNPLNRSREFSGGWLVWGFENWEINEKVQYMFYTVRTDSGDLVSMVKVTLPYIDLELLTVAFSVFTHTEE